MKRMLITLALFGALTATAQAKSVTLRADNNPDKNVIVFTDAASAKRAMALVLEGNILPKFVTQNTPPTATGPPSCSIPQRRHMPTST